ncbi:MAG: SDR family NAD(P)-dependent oxidoreductase, partial [Acidobacteriota bacterium]|nr:SDR family NAD(P)-dependent oxidoreductase [Acidobacteriota bacterium]
MSASAPVAVVTGGARRLGRHLSLMLATRGYDLVILYRSSGGEAQALVQEIAAAGRRARAMAVDVADESQVAAAFAGIANDDGRVDLLLNNVGNYNPQDVTELTPAVWDATLAANLSGAYYCCFHALKVMPAGGNIINIGMAGLEGIRANVRGADYYVSKTGLL